MAQLSKFQAEVVVNGMQFATAKGEVSGSEVNPYFVFKDGEKVGKCGIVDLTSNTRGLTCTLNDGSIINAWEHPCTHNEQGVFTDEHLLWCVIEALGA